MILLFITSCAQGQSIDTGLLDELERMVVLDQLAASNSQPTQISTSLTKEEWKDSIYRAHASILEEILDDVGYPGYDLVGNKGSQLYWVMVQHADFDPLFQKRVLDSMYIEVQNSNADSRNYAFLKDRVNLNFGEEQVYGTQVDYNLVTGKAHYKQTIDPEKLNKRRADIGLEPIEDYLKQMTKDHLQRNSVIAGITNVALILIITLIIILGMFFLYSSRLRKLRGAKT